MSVVSILNLNENSMVPALKEAAEKLDGVEVEMVLDCSSIRRLDASSLRAIHDFGRRAEGRAKVTIRGLNLDGYKALKLARLTGMFSFSD